MTAEPANGKIVRQSLAYGSELIDFELIYSPRRRLTITVQPDGEVVVNAPAAATLESVLHHVRKRAGWIIRQRDRFAAFGPVMPQKQYVSGETHRYLGRQYRLNITAGTPSSVKLSGRYFEIVTPIKEDSSAIHTILEEWYRKRALIVFGQHMERCLKSSHFRRLNSPRWSLRKMKRRWGSCTTQGTILLNPLLVQASPGCVDYVITHELCHIIHHSHGTAFFRLLSKVMYDWPKWKERLEKM